jgi:outer membrane protein assembly factor BamB
LIAVDGTLYAANLESIEALDADTGKVYWSFPNTDQRDATPFYSTPVFAPEFGEHGLLLVAGFKDQTVYALELGSSVAERPDEVWRFDGAAGQYVGTGAVTDGLFIIGNGDGKVYALRLDDGSKAWEFATQDRVWAAPVVDGNTVYVTSLDHRLYALDVETGAERWRFEAGGAISATPVLANGALWVGDFTSTLYQIDLESQDAVWTFEANDWLWASPLLDGDNLYFADVGGDVYALNIVEHTMAWDGPVSLGDTLHGQPALNEDGSLLFVAGYEKGTVYAIDVVTGMQRESWGTTLENPGRLPGDLVTDGKRLYTMPILVQERVQAFDLATGELLWSMPETGE